MSRPVIAVLGGGTSAEREVSVSSGLACAVALARSFPTRFFDVTENALPAGLDPAQHVVFSTLHGTFGEDGAMQRLMDAAGIEYAGSGEAASALTIDKARTKELVARHGVRGTKGLFFAANQKPAVEAVVRELGENLVLKPNAEGSSVGLSLVQGAAALAKALAGVTSGDWLIEQRVMGRELSVGVLHDRPLGVVEIRPKSGVYDYQSKYTKGASEYFAPAPIGEKLTAEAKAAALTAYTACGCRDFARVDFMLSAENLLYLLEINTLPGMKEMSLLPMSARCEGLDFTALVREMVTPALARFHAATPAISR